MDLKVLQSNTGYISFFFRVREEYAECNAVKVRAKVVTHLESYIAFTSATVLYKLKNG